MNVDKTSYYSLNSGQKTLVVPNQIFQIVRKCSFLDVVRRCFKIKFSKTLWTDMDEYNPVHIPTSPTDYSIKTETAGDSEREMCNVYGYINPNIFGKGYKYFYVCVRTVLDEFSTDNETLVPILAVLKKQADTRFEQIDDILYTTIVFSYSSTGVANMQKVMTECENNIAKFIKNIYSINTNIIIRERTPDTDEYVKQFYRYYIANNIYNKREIIFKRYSTKKYLKTPENYNFYWVNPEDWTYRVYKWPVIVYDNGDTELDISQSYDPTRDITIGNKTFTEYKIKYLAIDYTVLYTDIRTLKKYLKDSLVNITGSDDNVDIDSINNLGENHQYNLTEYPYIIVYFNNSDKLTVNNTNENVLKTKYDQNEILMSNDPNSFYKNANDFYNRLKDHHLAYEDGYCTFGKEVPVEMKDYESYDQWSNPIRKTS